MPPPVAAPWTSCRLVWAGRRRAAGRGWPRPEAGAILDTLPLGNDSVGLPLPVRTPMARKPRNGAAAAVGFATAAGTALAGALVGAAALLIAV